MAGKQAESQHPETRENDVPDRALNSPAAEATNGTPTDMTGQDEWDLGPKSGEAQKSEGLSSKYQAGATDRN
jgi:hypothetical protein